MIATILAKLAAVIGRAPMCADRPFDGPFVTVHAPAPRRPRPYDWASDDGGRDVR